MELFTKDKDGNLEKVNGIHDDVATEVAQYWTRIFQAPEVVEAINKTRKKYLMSLDNGVTYKEFE